MTTQDKIQILELLKRFESEELDCNGNCSECYYCMESSNYYLDNCPILVAYDMIYRKIYKPEDWDKKKG